MVNQSTVAGILFADVSSSTRLYDILGDAAARAVVKSCLGLIVDTVLQYDGSVIEVIGDEVMAVFDDPVALFDASVAIQCRIKDMPSGTAFGDVKPLVRIGFYVGPLIIQDGRYFGQTINLASRLAGLAQGGQIFTASASSGLFNAQQRQHTRELGYISIKGRPDGIGVLEIQWRATADGTIIAIPGHSSTTLYKKLKLSYCGHEWLHSGENPITLGRDPKNDVVLLDRRASRTHARIERRLDKWVFADQSANGTFVIFTGEPGVRVHHEELTLSRSGTLSIDNSSAASSDCVYFTLE